MFLSTKRENKSTNAHARTKLKTVLEYLRLSQQTNVGWFSNFWYRFSLFRLKREKIRYSQVYLSTDIIDKSFENTPKNKRSGIINLLGIFQIYKKSVFFSMNGCCPLFLWVWWKIKEKSSLIQFFTKTEASIKICPNKIFSNLNFRYAYQVSAKAVRNKFYSLRRGLSS